MLSALDITPKDIFDEFDRRKNDKKLYNKRQIVCHPKFISGSLNKRFETSSE